MVVDIYAVPSRCMHTGYTRQFADTPHRPCALGLSTHHPMHPPLASHAMPTRLTHQIHPMTSGSSAHYMYLVHPVHTPGRHWITRGKNCLSNFISSSDGPVKSTEMRQAEENSRTRFTTERWQPPLWPPVQCTCILSSLCTQQSDLGIQVHCVGGQWGSSSPLFCSRVEFLSFPIPALFLSFLQVHPTWNEVLQKFSLTLVLN